jgi:putative transposase
MSKKLFSEADQMLLLKRSYVSKISEKSITFKGEFKRLFIEEHMVGKLLREIFERHGLPVHIIGMIRVEQSADRWKKAYNQDGIIGLLDNRIGASGRPLLRELTSEEVISKQEAQSLNSSRTRWIRALVE